MKQMQKIILSILVLQLNAWALNAEVNFASVVQAFNSFQYEQVIEQSQILIERNELDSENVSEVLRMKSIAHYGLNQRDLTVICFVDILKIDPEYQLDPLRNSPKLITLFNKTKKNYSPMVQPVVTVENTYHKDNLATKKSEWQGSVLRSLAFPGWGHLHAKESGKGWTLTSASLLSLSASIYMSVQTERLESWYLNETNDAKIEQRYKDYNEAFKLRNGFILTYAVIWAYSQVDLSFRLFKDSSQQINGQVLSDGAFIQYCISF